jgi:hypothetical protein
VVSVARLREAAQARVDASSRRAVAREIGIQPRGLEWFLEGANPYQKTLEKLLRWYREQFEEAEGPPISGSEALRVLLRAVPPADRPEAAKDIETLLRRVHDRARVEMPPDLDSLETAFAPSSAP